MAAYDENVVIVREKESIIVRSISMKINELGLNLNFAGERVGEVKKFSEDTDIFIVYINNITDEVMDTLEYLMELVSEKGQRLIVIGEKDHYIELSEKIPEIRSKIWIDRPLDMEQFEIVMEDILIDIRKIGIKRNILIVDDDPDYAKIVRGWLKDKYQVFVVTTGVQAISFLMKQTIDLILLDYEMPVADGPQVLQMLRQDVGTAHIPVVFLTGIGTKEAVARVVELKPSGYILKSTPRDELIEYVDGKMSGKNER